GFRLLPRIVVEAFPRGKTAAVREELAQSHAARMEVLGNAIVERPDAFIDQLMTHDSGADRFGHARKIKLRERCNGCDRCVWRGGGGAHAQVVRYDAIDACNKLKT